MRFLEATRLDTAHIGRSEASKWRVSEPDTKNNPLSKSESDSASGEGVSTRPEKVVGVTAFARFRFDVPASLPNIATSTEPNRVPPHLR